jgi:hypothetical protein
MYSFDYAKALDEYQVGRPARLLVLKNATPQAARFVCK